MENASKALIMAGGVLLGILLISLLLSVYTQINKTQEESAKIQATKELAEFNAYYESYNKEVVYGAEILTLINKAYEDNTKYNLNIEIKRVDAANNEYDISIDKTVPDEKETKYRCVGIDYEQGRVKKIKFYKIDTI